MQYLVKKKLFFFAISKVESLLFCVVLPLYNPNIFKYITILVYINYRLVSIIMILRFTILLQGLDLIQDPTL
jgi:hypothetical protein